MNIYRNIIHSTAKKKTLRTYGYVKSMDSKEIFPKTITNLKPLVKENSGRPQKKLKGSLGKTMSGNNIKEDRYSTEQFFRVRGVDLKTTSVERKLRTDKNSIKIRRNVGFINITNKRNHLHSHFFLLDKTVLCKKLSLNIKLLIS